MKFDITKAGNHTSKHDHVFLFLRPRLPPKIMVGNIKNNTQKSLSFNKLFSLISRQE